MRQTLLSSRQHPSPRLQLAKSILSGKGSEEFLLLLKKWKFEFASKMMGFSFDETSKITKITNCEAQITLPDSLWVLSVVFSVERKQEAQPRVTLTSIDGKKPTSFFRSMMRALDGRKYLKHRLDQRWKYKPIQVIENHIADQIGKSEFIKQKSKDMQALVKVLSGTTQETPVGSVETMTAEKMQELLENGFLLPEFFYGTYKDDQEEIIYDGATQWSRSLDPEQDPDYANNAIQDKENMTKFMKHRFLFTLPHRKKKKIHDIVQKQFPWFFSLQDVFGTKWDELSETVRDQIRDIVGNAVYPGGGGSDKLEIMKKYFKTVYVLEKSSGLYAQQQKISTDNVVSIYGDFTVLPEIPDVSAIFWLGGDFGNHYDHTAINGTDEGQCNAMDQGTQQVIEQVHQQYPHAVMFNSIFTAQQTKAKQMYENGVIGDAYRKGLMKALWANPEDWDFAVEEKGDYFRLWLRAKKDGATLNPIIPELQREKPYTYNKGAFICTNPTPRYSCDERWIPNKFSDEESLPLWMKLWPSSVWENGVGYFVIQPTQAQYDKQNTHSNIQFLKSMAMTTTVAASLLFATLTFVGMHQAGKHVKEPKFTQVEHVDRFADSDFRFIVNDSDNHVSWYQTEKTSPPILCIKKNGVEYFFIRNITSPLEHDREKIPELPEGAVEG